MITDSGSWFIGYPICPTTPALIAGAVFGAVFSGSLSLLSGCIIGMARVIPLQEPLPNGGSRSGTISASCCGNRYHAMAISTVYSQEPGVSGHLTSTRTRMVYNIGHNIGILWGHNLGLAYGYSTSHDMTTTRTQSTTVTITRH
jgi:hypothetical protein